MFEIHICLEVKAKKKVDQCFRLFDRPPKAFNYFKQNKCIVVVACLDTLTHVKYIISSRSQLSCFVITLPMFFLQYHSEILNWDLLVSLLLNMLQRIQQYYCMTVIYLGRFSD